MAALLAYGIAGALGGATVLHVFPTWALLGHLPPTVPTLTDFAQHLIGQLYFLAQPWSWPLLVARRLDAAHGGTNIAFTDSIPLLLIATKSVLPVLPVLPGVRQTITIYQAGAWFAQPVAAVFALRSTGERRLVPALAVAVIALSMPAFLARLWQAALDGHAFLLVELGLALRVAGGSRRALGPAAFLPVLLLLVHPYLMLMALTLLASAPLTLMFRHDRFALAAGAATVGAGVGVVALGALGGYWGQASTGGFGRYSMNLVGPIWPAYSTLIGHGSIAPVDATGLQAGEGYQYLGAGVLLLLLVACTRARGATLDVLRRHPGLAAICTMLMLLALSNRVYLFHTPILLVGMPSHLLEQARSSGRFFWPCTYVLLIGAAALVARQGRWGVPLLAVAATLQFVDATTWRASDRAAFRFAPAPFDVPRLAAVFRSRSSLALVPTFPCDSDDGLLMDALWLGARSTLRTNTMYAARSNRDVPCASPSAIDRPVAAGTVRLVLPPNEPATVAAIVGGARDCRVLAPYAVCTADAAGLDGLPHVPAPPSLPFGRALSTGAGDLATGALVGWWRPTGPVSQTDGIRAWLAFRVGSSPTGAVFVTLLLRTAALPARARRTVTVHDADDVELATFDVGASAAPFTVAAPAPGGVVQLRLDISHPARVSGEDPRIFGAELLSLRVDPAHAASTVTPPRFRAPGPGRSRPP